ncbi:hypothetical protein [Methylobacterium sp. NEAU K]|uniref:hypothetical protein n=1 Tax=Methylobacterium sp. NEAU K TaxID=3064946 RepID=UPI0027332AB2|nr:hypothetical protein [Methylobacterium sp. NEAU K]MDP4005054.1 hypothetical protein [Methylobacterium sp. NEAU K]
MTYTLKEHGTWSPYTPNPMPQWAAALGNSIKFLRSDASGVDWYTYRGGARSFAAGSVLATTLKNPATGVESVKAVGRDPSMLFPSGQRLIEISGVDPTEANPLGLFEEMTFDPVSLTFSAPVAPTPPPPTSCTKLGLKRAFDQRNLWPTVREMIASNADMQEEWDLAVSVQKSDPLIQVAIAGLAQQGIAMSDADVAKLIADAVAAVAPPAQVAAAA